MLQPPLTLPSGSPWDPCIDVQPLLCVSIATIMSSSAGCLSALHQRPQTPETRTRAAAVVGREDKPRPGPKMPHFTRCEPLDSANATEAAMRRENVRGMASQRAARISTKLCSPRFTRSLARSQHVGG